MNTWTTILSCIVKNVGLYILLPIIVIGYLSGCDFFDKSEQPMGTGDTDLLTINWNELEDYVSCSLYLKPDETGTHMTAEFMVSPNSSIVDFVDFSTTTFDMGGEMLQVPISTLLPISDTVTTLKRYRTLYDSLPFFEMGERVSVRVSSPYWGISEKSFTYPELENILDSSHYFDSTGELKEVIDYNLSLDYGTSGYILKTTYVTMKNGLQDADDDSVAFDYFDKELNIPLLTSHNSNTIVSIDSVGIVYAISERGRLRVVNYYSGYHIQTQPSKEFIIKPNKRNK